MRNLFPGLETNYRGALKGELDVIGEGPENPDLEEFLEEEPELGHAVRGYVVIRSSERREW